MEWERTEMPHKGWARRIEEKQISLSGTVGGLEGFCEGGDFFEKVLKSCYWPDSCRVAQQKTLRVRTGGV